MALVCDGNNHTGHVKAIYRLQVFALDPDQSYDPNNPNRTFDSCGECFQRLTDGASYTRVTTTPRKVATRQKPVTKP
jgi:hypothetical protein